MEKNKHIRLIQIFSFITIFLFNFINLSEVKEAPVKIDSEIFNEIKGFRIRSASELDLIREISDLTFLQFGYKKSSVRSQKVAKHIKGITERLQDLVSIAIIDCDNFIPKNHNFCVEYEYIADSFPRLKLLIPPETKWNKSTKKLEAHTEYPWTEKEMTEDSILHYITSNIPYKGIKLKEFDFDQYLNNDYFNKVILFTDVKVQLGAGDTDVIWKGLSNYFFDRILFAEVGNNAKEIISFFNITKFPTIALYKINDRNILMDEPEIIEYEGALNLVEIKKLIEWIEPHATVEKRYIRLKLGLGDLSAEEIARKIELRRIDKDSYSTFLNKFSDKNILFYFDTMTTRIRLNVKQEMVVNQGFFNSALYDCSNDKLFCLEKFNVKKFPMLKMIPKIDENKNITMIDDRIQNIFTLNISESCNLTLADQIREIFPSKVKKVAPIEFPYVINESKFKKKFIIAHLYKSSEQNSTKALLPLDLISTDERIQKYFDFYSVENILDETIKMQKFTSNSGIFFMYLGPNDQYKFHTVTKDVFYSSLKCITNNFIFHLLNSNIRQDFTSGIVKYINSNNMFKKDCVNHEYCVFAFFDVRPGHEAKEIFSRKMELLENIKLNNPKYDQIPFNWLNATCHGYLAKSFDVDMKQLPSIVVIAGDRNAFSTFNGLWQNFPLNNFLERALSNRFQLNQLSDEEIFMKNLSCENLIEEGEASILNKQKNSNYIGSEESKNNSSDEKVISHKATEAKTDL